MRVWLLWHETYDGCGCRNRKVLNVYSSKFRAEREKEKLVDDDEKRVRDAATSGNVTYESVRYLWRDYFEADLHIEDREIIE